MDDLTQLRDRVLLDARHGSRDYLDTLSTRERDAVLAIIGEISKTGKQSLLADLWELDWLRKPVSPREFFDNPDYVGRNSERIYPVWKDELAYVLNPANQITEICLTGGIGAGKTTVAQLAQLYKLYVLSCLRDPYTYFPDLMHSTLIVFMMLSLTLDKAALGVYWNFRAMIDTSPYFRREFPYTKKPRRIMGGKQKFDDDDRIVQLPKGISVELASKVSHAQSLSVYSAILDEVNFRSRKTITDDENADSAVAIYEEIADRIQSRFMSKTLSPGILCTVSSKKSTSDFIDRHIEKVKDDPHVRILDYKIWDVKPDRKYSGKRFFIKVGTSMESSYIITESKEDKYYRALFDEGSKEKGRLNDSKMPNNVHSIPEEYMLAFQRDMVKSLQNIAGVSTSPLRLLFDDPTLLNLAIDPTRVSPFDQEVIEIGVKQGKRISERFSLEKATVYDGINRTPRRYPRATRFVHVDLAKGRRDSVGIAMCCISKMVNIEVPDINGTTLQLIRPEIYVDFVVKVRAPIGDEIDFEELRQFLIWLRQVANYKLSLVSYDQYQSVDSMQLLQKAGFKTRPVSVDRTPTAYLTLRETIVESRLNMYNYRPLFDELRNLIWDEVHQSVDHPVVMPTGSPGSKDTSDALAGSVKNAMDAITDIKLPGNRSGMLAPTQATPDMSPSPSSAPMQSVPNDITGTGIGNPFTPQITDISGNVRKR